tara:strand:- start:1126 stop:1530 length:405 start_codon:yes stop_codon:yes gene_type:complete
MNVYIMAISLVINAVLLMAITGIVPFLLYISVLANLGLIWWAVKMLNSLREIEKDLDELLDSNNDFREHLERLYGLEMYYGDETLKGLIDHSRETVNAIFNFSYKHSLETKELTIMEDKDFMEDEDNAEEEEVE